MGQGTSKHLRRDADPPASQGVRSSAAAPAPSASMTDPQVFAPLPASAPRPAPGVAPHSARSARNVASTVLIVVGVVMLLVAAGLWGFNQWRYHEVDVEQQKLAAYATVWDQPSRAPEVDWAGLKAINDEVVGWLYVPGTTINYAVYQADDNERYLRHSAEGNYLLSGQLFLDYQNSAPGMADAQSIIYGHHLLNGTMFEQIAALDDQAAFDRTDTVWYVTEQGAYELEPLLMYYARADDQTVRTFSFASDDERRAYLQGLLDKAVTKRPDAAQIVQGASHVLSLVTCNYYKEYYTEDGTNGRSVLVCVPKDEAVVSVPSD